MRGYTPIKSQEDMEALLGSIADFHDSMTKELHLSNSGFVDTNHSMSTSPADVRVLIHSQWEPFCIELVFCSVFELSYCGASGPYWDATGQYTHSEIPVEHQEVSMNFDGDLKIGSRSLYYRIRPGWLGRPARFRGEVPSDQAIVATLIDDGWRQCSECFDAWLLPTEEQFSYCPSCGRLTELESETVQSDVSDGFPPVNP
jgi:hypothetical protein